MYVRFEYDLAYWGGDYDSIGHFVLVPLELCSKLGDAEAFRQHTGIDPLHIVHYSLDELYDDNGNL